MKCTDIVYEGVPTLPTVSLDTLGVGKTVGSKVGARRRHFTLIGVRGLRWVFIFKGPCKAGTLYNRDRLKPPLGLLLSTLPNLTFRTTG